MKLRSDIVTVGALNTGARALWRATGTTSEEFGRPIIGIANSFTEMVPGHVHLQALGRLVAKEIRAAGGVPKEFNTIAVDDGIAMGHAYVSTSEKDATVLGVCWKPVEQLSGGASF